MLKVIDCCRYLFCHTHEQHFLGKPLLDKNGLLRAVIIGRQFKLTDGYTGYRACINQSRHKLTHGFRLLFLLPVLCRGFGNIINHFGIVGDALCPVLTGVFLARLKDNNFLCVLVHIDTVRFPFVVLFKLRCFGHLC